MAATGPILTSLEAISHETTVILRALDEAVDVTDSDRREAMRRTLELRTKTQELFEWISAWRLQAN